MHWTHHIGWFVALLVIMAGLLFVFGDHVLQFTSSYRQQYAVQPLDENGVRIVPLAPAPRPEDTTAAQKVAVFHAFVSYVNSGFEPKSVTIRQGETVRFTNNSTRELWIAASGSSGQVVYPSVAGGCGKSALDSCRALSPGEYWQFTFTEKGTWLYANTYHKADILGLVVVE